MTKIVEVRYCVRDHEDGDGEPMVATHGAYCARCWGRLDMPLKLMPDMIQHLIGNAIPSTSAQEERVSSSGEAPLPFNQTAFDDASELYSLAVYWSAVWAVTLVTQPPSYDPPTDRNGYPYRLGYGARRTVWKNDRGTIVGLPASTSPEEAHRAIATHTRWIRDRLDTILASGAEDDIDAMTDAMRTVWKINARWPRVERPTFSVMPCPRQECNAKIAIYPPAYRGDAKRIVCTAGHWYPEEEYDHLTEVFLQVKREELKTQRIAERLARKHGIPRRSQA